MNPSIAMRRLVNQRLAQPSGTQPARTVAWLGAVQAQEYGWAKWALGLRMGARASDASIERACNDGRILRTHVMRPTWHFVAAADLRWLLQLTAPRVRQALAYASRARELDEALRTRATAVFERELSRGQHLTRAELGAALARAGIEVSGIRLALLTIHAELDAVMCSGARRGTQSTYALLADRVPPGQPFTRDEALAELATRYVRSHGPATVRDFVWWSGLTTADARRGLAMSGAAHADIDGQTYWSLDRAAADDRPDGATHLLPIYDEYIVAYRDHHAVPRGPAAGGVLPQALVIGGQIAGTWKAVRGRADVVLAVATYRRLTTREREALGRRAERYARFIGHPVSVAVTRDAGRRPT